MRKVIWSEYVQNGIEETLSTSNQISGYQRKPKWELREQGEAIFHGWGVNYEEFETGAGNFSTAIIELEDGTVKNIPAVQVRFISGEIDKLKKEK
ncbi:hypothetical protein KAR91_16780 [Candidatus Pacearchaeota archaeon]|nr:hypothetical protein [Candidatus Pacearchaeota archaeon]